MHYRKQLAQQEAQAWLQANPGLSTTRDRDTRDLGNSRARRAAAQLEANRQPIILNGRNDGAY